MWTGEKVISKTISRASLEDINEVLKRPCIIWDNEHANDYDQKRVYLGNGPFINAPTFWVFIRPVLVMTYTDSKTLWNTRQHAWLSSTLKYRENVGPWIKRGCLASAQQSPSQILIIGYSPCEQSAMWVLFYEWVITILRLKVMFSKI